MDSKRFFDEIIRMAAPQGIKAKEIKDENILFFFGDDKSTIFPICHVNKDGEAHYWEKDMDTPEKIEARRYITSACHSALEYVPVMENAPQLKAAESSEKYKLLLDHDGIVLAGTDMGPADGYKFVTWRYTYDKSGVTLGHYYPNKYKEAKEDFATRSGLISEHRLFNEDQMMALYRSASYSLDERTDLTAKQEDELKEIKKQIERTIPSAATVLKAEQQALTQQMNL
ncbi:MAG: hypothetical protein M0T74_15500 [Desulfitobacterium hafniense]|nr:hypothetical protein [Desulfitobacterium hafniense]